jgi:hypothetical protein
MTVLQPLWIQAETYQALDARLADTALLGANTTTMTRPGAVVPGYGGSLAVTQTSSPSMAVSIASGACTVPHASGQGNYRFVNDGPLTRTIAAANTSSRTDLVIARVYDTGDPLTSKGDIEVVQGTPGSPTTIPAGAHALLLAEVTVGANVTSITTAVAADRRVWTPAGILPSSSTARPASPFDGQTIWEKDTTQLAVWSSTGATWRTVPTGSSGTWAAYTPTWTGSTTNPTKGNSTVVGRYLRDGKTVHFTVSITVGGTGFLVGAGFYSIGLPLPAASVTGQRWACPAYYFDISPATEQIQHYVGVGIIGSGSSTISRIRFTSAVDGGPDGGSWSNSAPVIPNNGDQMDISGTYETA